MSQLAHPYRRITRWHLLDDDGDDDDDDNDDGDKDDDADKDDDVKTNTLWSIFLSLTRTIDVFGGLC